MTDPASNEQDHHFLSHQTDDALQAEIDKSRQYRLKQRASYATSPSRQGARDEAQTLQGKAYNQTLIIFSSRIQAISEELVNEKALLPRTYNQDLISELVERVGAIVDELYSYLENNHEPLYNFVHHNVSRQEQVEHVIDLGTAVGKMLEAYTDQTYSRFEARVKVQRLIAALEGLDPNGSAHVC